jgi:hypothetical protein
MKTGDRFSAVPLSASAGDNVSPQTSRRVSRRAAGRSASRNIVRPPAVIRSANDFPSGHEADGKTENGRLVYEGAIFRTANTLLFNEEAIIGTENGLLARAEGVCRFNMSLDFSRMDKICGKTPQTAAFYPRYSPVHHCQLLTINT